MAMSENPETGKKRLVIAMEKDPVRNALVLVLPQEKFEEFVKLVTDGGRAQDIEVLVEVHENKI